MSRVIYYLLFIISLVPFSGDVEAIEKVKDKKIESLLQKLVFVSEDKFKDFSLRVFSAQDDGECDGAPSTCPKVGLYLIISTLEEYPERSVYTLPKSYGWELLSVEEVDLYGEYEKHLFISLSKKVVSSDISQGWWSMVLFKIKISPWKFQKVKVAKIPTFN